MCTTPIYAARQGGDPQLILRKGRNHETRFSKGTERSSPEEQRQDLTNKKELQKTKHAFEPQREETYFLTCAANEYSNHPAHSRGLINLRCPHEATLDLCLSKMHPVKFLIRLRECYSAFDPVSILHKSIADRYRPVRVADGPIMARYRFM